MYINIFRSVYIIISNSSNRVSFLAIMASVSMEQDSKSGKSSDHPSICQYCQNELKITIKNGTTIFKCACHLPQQDDYMQWQVQNMIYQQYLQYYNYMAQYTQFVGPDAQSHGTVARASASQETVPQATGAHATVPQGSGQHGTVARASVSHATSKSKPKLQNLVSSSTIVPRNTKKRCGSCAVIMDIERFPVHQKQLNFGWCRSCCSSNISEPPMTSDDSLYDDYYDEQIITQVAAPIVYNDDDDEDDLSE